MIRNSVKNTIFQALNFDTFRFEDFSIKEEASTYGKICIYNSIEETYFFNMQFSGTECRISYSPGSIFTKEQGAIKLISFEQDIIEYIHDWLIRIKKDMLNPLEERFINQTIMDFKLRLEEKLKDVEDSTFTREECDELKVRLENLEEIISKEMSKNDELQSEVEKMKDEIEFLKDTIDKTSKKNWLKTAMIKFFTWSKVPENKKLIATGVETIKEISKIDFPNVIK